MQLTFLCHSENEINMKLIYIPKLKRHLNKICCVKILCLIRYICKNVSYIHVAILIRSIFNTYNVDIYKNINLIKAMNHD
jgi:hypothetical protein